MESYQCPAREAFHAPPACGHDRARPCRYCTRSVGALSTGGPDVCSLCEARGVPPAIWTGHAQPYDFHAAEQLPAPPAGGLAVMSDEQNHDDSGPADLRRGSAAETDGEPASVRDVVPWVRIMADHEASGFWTRNGSESEPHARRLGIPEELIDRIRAWCDRYSRGPGTLDVEAFSREGEALARAVKRACPHVTVIYLNEARLNEHCAAREAAGAPLLESTVGEARKAFECEIVLSPPSPEITADAASSEQGEHLHDVDQQRESGE